MEQLHRAELAAWKGGLSTKGADVYPDAGTPEYRAREAATIANTVASVKPHPNTETYVSRRGNRSLGVVQLDTYGHEKGYPVGIDWLATHPDVITGKTHEKGVGTELFTHAVKRAAELGVGLKLESAEGAKTFYKKMGMTPIKGMAGKHFELSPDQVKSIAGGQK
jgi:predicted N-acetyltransferase YhbS